MGITKEGEPGEFLCEEITGFSEKTEPKVEVKTIDRVKHPRAATINQVRPLEGVPLVVCVLLPDGHRMWYVVPPLSIIKIASDKPSGQHGISSLDNFSTTTKQIAAYECKESDLKETISKSFLDGETKCALIKMRNDRELVIIESDKKIFAEFVIDNGIK